MRVTIDARMACSLNYRAHRSERGSTDVGEPTIRPVVDVAPVLDVQEGEACASKAARRALSSAVFDMDP